jgi:hypothetical protein
MKPLSAANLRGIPIEKWTRLENLFRDVHGIVSDLRLEWDRPLSRKEEEQIVDGMIADLENEKKQKGVLKPCKTIS